MPGGFLDAFGFPVGGGGGGGGGGTGDVVGPASATDNALARFDLATGKLIQNSSAILSDLGALSLTSTGTTTGAFSLVADSITTSDMVQWSSNSADTNPRALFRLSNQNVAAINAVPFLIEQAAARQAVIIDQSGDGQGIHFIDPRNVTKTLIAIDDAVSLTTGGLISARSNATNTGTRTLVDLINDNTLATGTTVLRVQQDAAQTAVNVLQNANGIGLALTSASTTNHAAHITATALTSGSALRVESTSASAAGRFVGLFRNGSAAATGAIALQVEQVATQTALAVSHTAATSDAMTVTTSTTTGSGIFIIANSLTGGGALRVYSDSASATARSVASVTNDNVAATGATAFRVQQDSTSPAITIVDTANGSALDITSSATTARAVSIVADSLALGGRGLLVYSNSADVQSRALAEFNNDNAAAVGTTAVAISQDAAAIALNIAQNASGVGLNITSLSLTANPIQVTGDSLTSGDVALLRSNSADTSARAILRLINDNTAATGAVGLVVQQDAAQNSIDLAGTGGGSIRYQEVAAVPVAPGAGKGTTWVKNTTASSLVFTDDTGVDHSFNTFQSALGTTDQTITTVEAVLGQMSIAVATVAGENVHLTFSAGYNMLTSSHFTVYRLYRDAVNLMGAARTSVSSGISDTVSFHYVDAPGAGTFTYQIRALTSVDTTTSNAATSAIEKRAFTAEVIRS